MSTLISLKNLNFTYQEKTFGLQNIDLEINMGEVVVLIGKSGSGKSTITRTMNGLIPHFYPGEMTGQILLDGEAVDQLKTWQIGEKAGNVFQDPRSQFFANEVAGEIAFGCENYGLKREEVVKRVHESAETMDMLSLLNHSVHNLSYGMRQKLAIASARAGQPLVYIMDEPSANLDMEGTELLRKMIAQLKAEGKTVVIAEHRLYYLKDLADRFIEMENGAIKQTISPDEFKYMTTDIMKREGLRIQNLRELDKKEKPTRNQEILLEVKGIKKHFKRHHVLKQISFQVAKGEVLGVIGSNGTGKSTLGKVLAGLWKESDGEVFLDKKKLRKRQRMGQIWYIPQDLDSQLFGEDLLDELLIVCQDREKHRDKAMNILKALDLEEHMDKHPATLSGGQKQRLALGVSMMADAPLLILDEPTSGLDGENMRRISNLIQTMAAEGKSFIIITHDAEFCWNVCHRTLSLENGEIGQELVLEEPEDFLELINYQE